MSSTTHSPAAVETLSADRTNNVLELIASRVGRLNWLETVTAMTLILLLFATPQSWPFHPTLRICIMFGLLYRPALVHRSFWAAVTGILAIGYTGIWSTMDNHEYLITYWCATLTLALWMKEPEQVIRTSARLLIGLCFLFATAWKALTVEYADGSFFSFMLIGGDDRFNGFALLAGAASAEAIEANKLAIDGIKSAFAGGGTAELAMAANTNLVAYFMTWWTVLIEGLIAVCFLWRTDSFVSRYRDPVLIGFALSTYSVATVAGFGWLLVAMGFAQRNKDIWWVAAMYVFTFLVIALYSFPVTLLARSISNLFQFLF